MDETDEAIVELLQRDGRLPHSEIAAAIGLSRSAAASRLQRLLSSGRVEVRGVVHPAVLGLHQMTHVMLTVEGDAAVVADRMAGRDDTAFVSLVTGPAAVAVELRCDSLQAVDRAVAELRGEPGVRGVEGLLYFEVVHDVVGPVGLVPDEVAEVDDTDLGLLAALQEDGRASYVTLARRVGLSAPGARRRVLALERDGLVKVGALVRQSGDEHQAMTGLGLKLAGDSRPVIDLLDGLSQVTFVARTLGRHDLLVELRARTGAELVGAMSVIRQAPLVRSVDSWTHLRVVKETYARARPRVPGTTDTGTGTGTGKGTR